MANIINYDKYRNPYTVVGFKPNKNGYPVAYVDIKGDRYKLELTDSKKDGVMNWCRVTKMPKNMNFGNNNRGGGNVVF